MDLPIYSVSPSSDFLHSLQTAGFQSWHSFNIQSPYAFYQILAQGILQHLNFHYEISETITSHLHQHLPRLMQVYQGYNDFDRFSNPSYWLDIGKALNEDLLSQVTKDRFQAQLRPGTEISKSQEDLIMEIMTICGLALVWYEFTRAGTIAKLFYKEGNRNPFTFVSIAQEANSYYLLYHNEQSSGVVKEGFPFYQKDGIRTPNYPMVEQLSVPVVTSEPLTKCIEMQAQLIHVLMDTLVLLLPTEATPELVAKQGEVMAVKQVIQPLYEVCKVQASLETAAMTQFINLKIAPYPIAVQEHTYMNCELFPNDGEVVQHNLEVFHVHHLKAYLEQYQTCNCPKCGEILPDKLLEQLFPGRLYQSISWKYTEQTIRQSSLPLYQQGISPVSTIAPVQCSCDKSPQHFGSMYMMTCQYMICGGCLSHSQTLPGGDGWCPLCYQQMTSDERKYVLDAQNHILDRTYTM